MLVFIVADSSQNSATAVADQPSSVPSNQQFVYNSHPVQGFTPPRRHQSYHGHHHNEQKLQHSPQQQHPAYFSSNSHGREVRPMAGDFGDHKEVKLTSSSGEKLPLCLLQAESCPYTCCEWSCLFHFFMSDSLTFASGGKLILREVVLIHLRSCSHICLMRELPFLMFLMKGSLFFK